MFRNPCDTVVRPALPKPVRGGFGIVAKSLLGQLELVKGFLQRLSGGKLLGDIDVGADDFRDIAVPADDGMPLRMDVSYGTVRTQNPKINFERLLLPDCLTFHIDDPAKVFGEDPLLESLRRQIDLVRVESEQAIEFGRSVGKLLTAHVPGPAARVAEALGFGQIGFAATQPLFGFLCRSDVSDRSDKLDVAGSMSHHACHGMEIFDGSIGHQQAIFMVEIADLTEGPIKGLADRIAIFRMNALENEIERRFDLRVTLEDAKGLPGPDGLAGCQAQAEAAGAAQLLRLGKVGLALPQRILRLLALGDVFAGDQHDRPCRRRVAWPWRSHGPREPSRPSGPCESPRCATGPRFPGTARHSDGRNRGPLRKRRSAQIGRSTRPPCSPVARRQMYLR
ncbi:hypothetical protein ACVWZ6_005796 [Bradyrhizobium sp. GM6.1]